MYVGIYWILIFCLATSFKKNMSVLPLINELILFIDVFTDNDDVFANNVIHCKASGKVLITGGYLIIFNQYNGISIALNCYFHSIIKSSMFGNTIHVFCPQWKSKMLLFELNKKNFEVILVNKHCFQNVFIQTALNCFFQYISQKNKSLLYDKLNNHGIFIKLFGDKSFYQTINDTNNNSGNRKIGLGSSAALTVSLIKCLFKYFGINLSKNMHEFHSLCQLSHYISQEKVGSGFDISTAVYGSIIFKRPRIVNIDDNEFKNKLNSFKNINSLIHCIEECKFESISIPHNILLLMGIPNKSFGTKTVGMVRNVLKWKNNNPNDCSMIWNKLNNYNNSIINIFQKMNSLYQSNPKQYNTMIQSWTNKQITASNLLTQLKTSLKNIKELQRSMSIKSKVDIIPESIYNILIKTESDNDFIIGSGCPGAGGYDAVYILCVNNKPNIFNTIKNYWFSKDIGMIDILG